MPASAKFRSSHVCSRSWTWYTTLRRVRRPVDVDDEHVGRHVIAPASTHATVPPAAGDDCQLDERIRIAGLRVVGDFDVRPVRECRRRPCIREPAARRAGGTRGASSRGSTSSRGTGRVRRSLPGTANQACRSGDTTSHRSSARAPAGRATSTTCRGCWRARTRRRGRSG